MVIKDGTITPLQNVIDQTDFAKASDLDNYHIDLHLFSLFANDTAQGELLIDSSSKKNANDYCYLKFDYVYPTLTITDASSEVGGSGNCAYDGYKVGSIFFYFPAIEQTHKEANAMINGVANTTTTESTVYFTAFILNTPTFIKDISNVTFSSWRDF